MLHCSTAALPAQQAVQVQNRANRRETLAILNDVSGFCQPGACLVAMRLPSISAGGLARVAARPPTATDANPGGAAGEMTAMMGPSGSGKTTLLDLMAGRKTVGQMQGSILFAGQKGKAAFLQRYTGYVEQVGCAWVAVQGGRVVQGLTQGCAGRSSTRSLEVRLPAVHSPPTPHLPASLTCPAPAELTVREMLCYTAELKCPSSVRPQVSDDHLLCQGLRPQSGACSAARLPGSKRPVQVLPKAEAGH